MSYIQAEVNRYCAKFSKHYIQYSLLVVLMIIIYCLGIYFRTKGYVANGYDRLTYFNLIYYLLVLRSVLQGISTPYSEIIKEDIENKVLKNYTICKHSKLTLLFFRFAIKSIINTMLTIAMIYVLLVLAGMDYSLHNILYLCIVYFLAVWFMYGIGMLYTCMCKVFKFEKVVATIFQLMIIVFFIMFDGNIKLFSLFGQFKDELYNILFHEIVQATISGVDYNVIGFFLACNVISMLITFFLYMYSDYKCIVRFRKKYE